MSPTDRNFETIETNGVRLRTVVEGEGPLAILLHGWPQCWYLWRYQIDPLVAAGWKVAVPDQRGYGGSDCPPSVDDYGILDLCADVDGLATALGHDDYALVIHDWGCLVGYHTALLYPERVRAVAALSVPWRREPFTAEMCTQEFHGDRFFYWVYFQKPGVVEAELEKDVRASLLGIYYGASGASPERSMAAQPATAGFLAGNVLPATLPEWLTPEDLDYYVEQYRRTGFGPSVNWYRNIPRLHALTPQLEGARIPQPTWFMMGERDGVRHFLPPEGMDANYADLRGKEFVPGAGHWLPLEARERVNASVAGFLAEFR